MNWHWLGLNIGFWYLLVEPFRDCPEEGRFYGKFYDASTRTHFLQYCKPCNFPAGEHCDRANETRLAWSVTLSKSKIWHQKYPCRASQLPLSHGRKAVGLQRPNCGFANEASLDAFPPTVFGKAAHVKWSTCATGERNEASQGVLLQATPFVHSSGRLYMLCRIAFQTTLTFCLVESAAPLFANEKRTTRPTSLPIAEHPFVLQRELAVRVLDASSFPSCWYTTFFIFETWLSSMSLLTNLEAVTYLNIL